MTLSEIQEKIRNAPSLDFGDIINQAIELFKMVWLKGFLVVFITMICSFGLSFIFAGIGLTQNFNFFNEIVNLDTFYSLYFWNVIFAIPQTIIVSSVSMGLLAAFYRICKEQEAGSTSQDDFFYFFKNGYFRKILSLGIVYALIATTAQLLFLIPYIYVFVPLSYISIILANHPDLSETEIIRASFSLGNKKWLISFGTIFLMGLMGLLGILACGIGVLFTISIAYLPVYLIYKSVIGFEQMDEIDSIGQKEEFWRNLFGDFVS